MGRFLCIGIKTRVIVGRSDLPKFPPGETSAQTIIERNMVDSELYDLTITDNELIYSLKEEIVGKEWNAFLKEFYKMRYAETGRQTDDDDALEAVSACTTLKDWLSIASKKQFECYQMDTHRCVFYFDKGSHRSYIDIEDIILSMDGKIIMECYNDLFRFLRSCIKKRFAHYKLAATLDVYISD